MEEIINEYLEMVDKSLGDGTIPYKCQYKRNKFFL